MPDEGHFRGRLGKKRTEGHIFPLCNFFPCDALDVHEITAAESLGYSHSLVAASGADTFLPSREYAAAW